MSTKWRVSKYAAQDVDEFQRKVIDLAREIPKYINNKDELKNISRTLIEIAYNKPMKPMNIKDIIKKLPAARRKKIEARVKQLEHKVK